MSSLKTLFAEEVKVFNVGIPSFADDLKRQGVPVTHVEWRPPAGGNKRVIELLDRVKAWQAEYQNQAKS